MKHVAATLSEPTDEQLEPEDLQSLADFLLGSKAVSTTSEYVRSLGRYKGWCKFTSSSWLPLCKLNLIRYFKYLSEQKLSSSTITSFWSAIQWVSKLQKDSALANDNLLRVAYDSAVRTSYSYSLHDQRRPVSPTIIRKILEHLFETGKLMDSRFATFLTVLFYGFLRASEALNLKMSDITISNHSFDIHISQSKTDQKRLGCTLKVSKNGSEFCPLKIVKRHVSDHQIFCRQGDHSSCFLFCSLHKKNLLGNSSMSYSYARGQLQKVLKKLNVPHKITLHCFRAAGVTEATRAGGAPDRVIQAHGRWKTEKVKNGYLMDDEKLKLGVTKGMIL